MTDRNIGAVARWWDACLPRSTRRLWKWLAGVTALTCACTQLNQPDLTRPTVALFYGTNPPVAALSRFDAAVVEPDSGFNPLAQSNAGVQGQNTTRWFAYVSVGEITSQRSYYAKMPKAWIIGSNADWESHVVDQTAPEWPAFFIDNVITPLWNRGYHGFFLDTLDSYQRVAKTDAERARQQAGIVAAIRAIKARYPDARLIFNRGFELLPQVHSLAYVVAFESLYSGWNQGAQKYVSVPQQDRDWLLAQTKTIHERYGLPVLAIDYCAPSDTQCARDTVARIRADGVIPYVTDGGLITVGTGPQAQVEADAR